MNEYATRRDWILLGCLATTLLAGTIAYAPKAIDKSHRADFERYYYAGCVALQGGDIYKVEDDRQFKYFPFFAQCMMPLAWVSEHAAPSPDPTVPFAGEAALRFGAGLWYILLCLSYFGALLLATSLTKPPTLRRGMLIFGIALLITIRFFVANVRNGQINMPMMFLAVAGAWLILRGKNCRGGALIGVGAAIKFLPALLLLWMLRERRWWAAIYSVSAIAAALLIVPSATWGVEGNVAQLERYLTRRHKMVTDLPEDHAAGQSLPSMTNRLLRHVNAAPLRRTDKAGNRLPIYINLMDASKRTASAVAAALALAICGLALWKMPNCETANPLRNSLAPGLCFLLMLLVSPEARKAHYILTLLPVAALTAWLAAHAWPRRVTVPAALAAVFLMFSSSGILGRTVLYDYLNASGVLLWGGLLLFAATLAALSFAPPSADNTLDVR